MNPWAWVQIPACVVTKQSTQLFILPFRMINNNNNNFQRSNINNDEFLSNYFLWRWSSWCPLYLKRLTKENTNLFYTACEHNYRTRVTFPTHSPKVISSGWQGTLGHDKLSWWVITLKSRMHIYNSHTSVGWILEIVLIHHNLSST